MLHQQFNYRDLSLPERIMLVGEIWDSIAEDAFKEPLSASHRAELEERIQDIERNPHDEEQWNVVLEKTKKSL